jgi:hypothetical protein
MPKGTLAKRIIPLVLIILSIGILISIRFGWMNLAQPTRTGVSHATGTNTVTPEIIAQISETPVAVTETASASATLHYPPPDMDQTASPTLLARDTPLPAPSPTIDPGIKSLDTDIFGVTTLSSLSGDVEKMAEIGLYWMRDGLPWKWSWVEPSQGSVNWTAFANLEREMVISAEKGIRYIFAIQGTPWWAMKPGFACGAVAEDKLPAFGDFIEKLVERYHNPPYNIVYWDLWNEPDVAGALGCWGDPKDEYYGGGYYAKMLQVVYPRIKAVDPQAQVLIGGLMLDCDPNLPDCTGNKAKSSRFFEGLLQNGGGAYLDGVSFHAYDYYNGTGAYFNTTWNSASNTNGPALMAKAAYMRALLTQYGITGKYLLNTEVGLLCGRDGRESYCLTDDFQQTKSAYLVQSNVIAATVDLRANIWFSSTGWRASGLIKTDLSPLPAFNALQFMVAELRGAKYTRQIVDYPALKVFEFKKPESRVWVLWSPDGSPQSVNLLQTPLAVYDMYGNPLPATTTLVVDWKPIYIVLIS